MIGKSILHYEIIKQLGQGGMGIVYLARDSKLDRQVAIKFLPGRIASNSDERKRFEIEARAAAALNHPNIATIYNIEEADDEIFLVMEYISGQTLVDYLGTQHVVSQNDALNIAIQVAEGLQAAHEKGIVHRDIKPSNIMITEKGRVKIMDFGLAKMSGGNAAPLTKTGTTLGTVAYMSPEQTRGEDADPRSDIWSFGVVLYEMLAGRTPFAGDYDHAIMYDILNERPPSISDFRNDLPPAFQVIFERALVKDPAKRYQDIGYFLLDLNQIKKGSSLIESQAMPAARASKNKFLLPVAAFFLIIIVSAFWWLFLSDGEEAVAGDQRWESSIAVLPFKNISPEQDQEYFCDGMTEQIITNLSQLEHLKVIARTSVMRYKDTDKAIPEIAADLDVAHILEGSIRKAGDRIRITAQLIQADGGHHLWARDYDRELKDIFDVQDDVSQAIAAALLKQFSPSDAKELKTKATQNTEAYEYYLKGRHHYWNAYLLTDKQEDFIKADNLLKMSIKLDSSYAPAYAELADLYNTHYYNLDIESTQKKYLDLQKKLIEKAYVLDPKSVDVLRVKGWVYDNQKEYVAAYKSFKQALQINPNNTRTIFDTGMFLFFRGLEKMAMSFISKAIESDPLDANLYWRRAILFRVLGKLQLSLKDYQKALELDPNHIRAMNGIAKDYFLLNNIEMAEQFLARSEALETDVIDTKYARMFLYAYKGEKEKVKILLNDLRSDNKETKIVVHCLLGEKEEALALIGGQPWASYLYLLHSPYFKLIRNTDEFKIVLQKAKIEYDKKLAKYGDFTLK